MQPCFGVSLSCFLLGTVNCRKPVCLACAPGWLMEWPRGAQFKPQMLANLLWALATLAVAPPPLLSALAAEVLRQLPNFKPQARTRCQPEGLA